MYSVQTRNCWWHLYDCYKRLKSLLNLARAGRHGFVPQLPWQKTMERTKATRLLSTKDASDLRARACSFSIKVDHEDPEAHLCTLGCCGWSCKKWRLMSSWSTTRSNKAFLCVMHTFVVNGGISASAMFRSCGTKYRCCS